MFTENVHFYVPKCYKDFYVNSFLPHSANLLNSLLPEFILTTHDLNVFRSRVKSRHLFSLGFFFFFFFWKALRFRFFFFFFFFFFSTAFLCLFFFFLFLFHFIVKPCIVIAVEPYMEWNPNKKIFSDLATKTVTILVKIFQLNCKN